MPDDDTLGPDGREHHGRSPAGEHLDVVDVLLVQHARIEDLFLLASGLEGAAKQEAFDDLVRLLAVHETAEEEVVHPLSRTLEAGATSGGYGADDGDRNTMVDDRLAEERQANEALKALVDAGVDSEGFDVGLLLLRDAVITHARYEERYEFPLLRSKVPAQQLRALATVVRAAEAAAPTRPHPGTESLKANLVAGPILAVADRARDLIRDARRSDS